MKMPNLAWPSDPTEEYWKPSVLVIEPGEKPGAYKFSIDGQDISRWIGQAEIVFDNGEYFQPSEINIGTPVEIPPQIKVILFTGEKPNGSNTEHGQDAYKE